MDLDNIVHNLNVQGDPARVLDMATTYEHQALDRQLCFALYAASRAVTRTYGPLLEKAGLPYPQYITMLALWEHPGEPMTVGDLGSRLRLETGTLTPLLKRLEALGYLHRRLVELVRHLDAAPHEVAPAAADDQALRRAIRRR